MIHLAMKFHLPALACLLLSLVGSGCLHGKENAKPLKELFEKDFLIGNALGGGLGRHPLYRNDEKALEILTREFNSVTPENCMKMEFIQPREGSFKFAAADALLELAESNGMAVVGHTLIWHSQAPDWIFKDKSGNRVSRDVLIERMRTHIHTVVGRYKGRIAYWDVVNEAIQTKMVRDNSRKNPDGSFIEKEVAFYRPSPWYEIIGEEYVELAFKFAHEADPEAKLLYNDYSMFHEAKARFAAKMVADIKAKGIPVHGVGMQGHWHLQYPSMKQVQDAIDILSGAGVKISITELDVGVLPLADGFQGADVNRKAELRKELDPYTKKVPRNVLKKQAQKYKSIFELLLENRDRIDRVTIWGVVDKHSWKNNWPIEGRTAHPLLFDRNYEPKPAYWAITELKK